MVWPAIIAAGAAIGSAILANKGQQDANDAQAEQAQLNRDFNSAEAAKTREWQENMRQTQYQTAVSDLKAAGLNPMLAYQQGGAGTPSGATASSSSMPQIGNKVAAALTAGAQAAQIMNLKAQTEKTQADTEVSHATAKQVEAQTHLTTSSTTKVQQETENLKETINQIRQNVHLQRAQTGESLNKQVLTVQQAELTRIEQQLTQGKIGLTEAQTQLTRVTTKLSELDVAGSQNKSDSDKTWWGRNVRPYLGDLGSATNSATKAGRLYQLTR